MRFMVITKATADSEAGRPPATEDFDTMGKFIEEMMDAGVLLAADGLHPSSQGARIHFDGGKRTVVDGPFTETKELIAGFFLVEMKSMAECVEWFKRYPMADGGDLEIRRVIQAEDFADVMTGEQRAAVQRRDEGARYN
ncbi:YciI family protein [Actinoplanes sp. URMC 104]|uniref:YciI family protein n=1 Tax=Actinoplanes sp. URMC 104 TaxID=3423409 RepID=UPI003F1C1F4A